MIPTTAHTETGLIVALRTIRTLWPAILTQTRTASVGAASSDDITALDRRIFLRYEVTMIVNGWARVVVEDRHTRWRIPLGTDTVGMCVFLERHAQWMSGHEAALDALEELRDCARQVRAATVPARKDWLAIGECPMTVLRAGELVRCDGRVRAYIHRPFPRCPRCGTEEPLSWWMTHIIPAGSDLAHADAVIAFVVSRTFRPISHEQLRQWAVRGRILRHGRDEKGRTLYSSRATLQWVVNQVSEAAAS